MQVRVSSEEAKMSCLSFLAEQNIAGKEETIDGTEVISFDLPENEDERRNLIRTLCECLGPNAVICYCGKYTDKWQGSGDYYTVDCPDCNQTYRICDYCRDQNNEGCPYCEQLASHVRKEFGQQYSDLGKCKERMLEIGAAAEHKGIEILALGIHLEGCPDPLPKPIGHIQTFGQLWQHYRERWRANEPTRHKRKYTKRKFKSYCPYHKVFQFIDLNCECSLDLHYHKDTDDSECECDWREDQSGWWVADEAHGFRGPYTKEQIKWIVQDWIYYGQMSSTLIHHRADL